MPWRGAEYEGEVPTLGWDMLDWYSEYLIVPDGPAAGDPLELTEEQAQFFLNFYKLDPLAKGPAITGRALVNWRIYNRAILCRPKGWGKALDLRTPVATPTGWSSIGELRVGDQVFDETGRPTTVVAKSEVWSDADCYAITFSDGEQLTASGDHLWTVEALDRAYASETISTRELIHRLARRDGARNWRLPMPAPIRVAATSLDLDPYVLGAWLGDGDSDAGRLTGIDREIFDHVEAAGFPLLRLETKRASFKGLAAPLRRLGVFKNKHIPTGYLRAGESDRWALIQGLMDTDGSVYDRGVCEFTTTSEALRDGFVELAASLGIKTATYAGVARFSGRDYGPKYRIKFTAFTDQPVVRIRRKVDRLRPRGAARVLAATRRIISVERVPTVPTQCIEVDSPSHLFLAGRKMVQTHNSPILGAAAVGEAVGPVVFDGWDANGEPVGRPWASLGFKAKVQVLATSEDQTGNTWDPILDMVRGSPTLIDDYGLDPMETFISGDRVRLEYATSAGDSREGGRPIFAVFDQTESWRTSNGGVKLAAAVRRNLTKTQGSSIESPNAYAPGDGSVAEKSFLAAELQEKRAANPKSRARVTILLDHRGAPAETDIYDEKKLKVGLGLAYGDSADLNGGWVNLDRVVEDFWDPDSTVEDSRRFFLNQITERADSWISLLELDTVKDEGKVVADGEMITLGFDGSRGRKRGTTDATALIACRVRDGHVFEPFPGHSVWEQPHDFPKSEVWSPPASEIDSAVRQAMKQWKVVGFYADPALWESYIAKWEAAWGAKLLVKSTKAHPIEWWMTGQRSGAKIAALKTFKDAVLDAQLTWDGSVYLSSHITNARMVPKANGIDIDKQHPDSAQKIDAAIAAVLAYLARLDAIAAGALKKPKKRAAVARIR